MPGEKFLEEHCTLRKMINRLGDTTGCEEKVIERKSNNYCHVTVAQYVITSLIAVSVFQHVTLRTNISVFLQKINTWNNLKKFKI